jgi:hypothetical protein
LSLRSLIAFEHLASTNEGIWEHRPWPQQRTNLRVANGTEAFNAKRHAGSHTLAGITPDKFSEHIFSEKFSEEAR